MKQEEAIKATIEAKLGGVEAFAKCTGRHLTVTLIGVPVMPRATNLKTQKAALEAIDASGVEYLAVKLITKESRTYWHGEAIEEIVRSALGPLASSHLYHKEIAVRLEGNSVRITVACSLFCEREKVNTAYKLLEPVYEDILRVADADRVDVRISDGMSSYEPIMAAADDGDDFDEAPPNPNWPSRTGNPSGGGRGNNPPRSG